MVAQWVGGELGPSMVQALEPLSYVAQWIAFNPKFNLYDGIAAKLLYSKCVLEEKGVKYSPWSS